MKSDIFEGEITVDMAKKPQKPIWQIAHENNKKPKVLIDRKKLGWRSDSTVFTGC